VEGREREAVVLLGVNECWDRGGFGCRDICWLSTILRSSVEPVARTSRMT
jgi:hypothetical protein